MDPYAIIMWCQLVTASGEHVTEPVEAILTGESMCAINGCSKGVRIREKGSKIFRLVRENGCFYSNPKNSEENE